MTAGRARYVRTFSVACVGAALGACLMIGDAASIASLAAFACLLLLFFGFVRASFRDAGAPFAKELTERFGDKHATHFFSRPDEVRKFVRGPFFLRVLILLAIFLVVASFTGGVE